VEIVAGDLRDEDAVRRACLGCSVVLHLGALIAIPYSYRNPRDAVETNVLGTLNVLEGARATGVARVVHISSSEVYGSARFVPITEAHPLQGQSPYSASKIAADKLAESYYRSFALPVVTVRPFNTYGPRQSARAVIPTIVSQVLSRGEVELGSLAPRRDFTYVADTVEGIILASEVGGVEGATVNLGTGKDISIGELTQTILRILEVNALVRESSDRVRPALSEVDRLQSDNSLAREMLGWRPEVGLEQGLRTTISWIQENLGGLRPGVYQT